MPVCPTCCRCRIDRKGRHRWGRRVRTLPTGGAGARRLRKNPHICGEMPLPGPVRSHKPHLAEKFSALACTAFSGTVAFRHGWERSEGGGIPGARRAKDGLSKRAEGRCRVTMRIIIGHDVDVGLLGVFCRGGGVRADWNWKLERLYLHRSLACCAWHAWLWAGSRSSHSLHVGRKAGWGGSGGVRFAILPVT